MSVAEKTARMLDQIKASDMASLRQRFRDGDAQERGRITAQLRPMEVEFADIRLIVDPRDNYTETRLWLDGYPPELKSLLALVELVEDKNAYILDVGANCGAFTIPLALASGEGSRVVAFEPNPVMIGRLGTNIRLNDLGAKVRIEGCALSDRTGEATLHFRNNNFGQASLKQVKRNQQAGTALVPTRPLSDFADAAAGHEISVLKMDIEGVEDIALNPLLDAAQSGGWLPDVILIEVRHAEQWDTDLCTKILSCGYKETLQVEGNALYIKQ